MGAEEEEEAAAAAAAAAQAQAGGDQAPTGAGGFFSTRRRSGSHAVRLRLGSHLLTSEDVMFHPLDEAVDVTHLTGNDRFGARRTSLVADTFQARHFGGEFVTFSSIVATIVF